MKKRLTLLLMTIAVVMTLAACGSQDEDYVEGYKLSEIPLPQVSKTEWMYQDSYDVAQEFMDYMGYYAEDVYEMNEYPIVKWGKISQMYVECKTESEVYWLELGVNHEKDVDGEPVDGYYLVRYYVEDAEYDGEISDDSSEQDDEFDINESNDINKSNDINELNDINKSNDANVADISKDMDWGDEVTTEDDITETDVDNDESESLTDSIEALDADYNNDEESTEGEIPDNVQEFADGDADYIVSSFIDWIGIQFMQKESPKIDSLDDNMAVSISVFVAYNEGYYDENDDYEIIISQENLDEIAKQIFGKTYSIGSFSGNEYVTKTDDGQLKLVIGEWGTLYPDYTIQNVKGNNNKFEIEVGYFTVDAEAGEDSATKYTAYYTFEPSNQSEYGYVITNMRASAN